MTSNSQERKIRRSLFPIRLLQAYMPLPLSRWLIDQGLARMQLRGDVTRETVSANGVPCEWIIPQDSPKDKVLLYLHGGGFVYGLTPLHLVMVAYLAQKMGIRALMVDYRLGPEHPYPAALDDCITSYRWLLDQGVSAQNIVVAGDSAGGNLTITMMMKLRDNGEKLPSAAACLSPVADLAERRGSFNDPLLHPKAVKMFDRSYVADNDPRNPYISPAYGDFRGLPPLLIHAGEDEILREDSVRVEALAKAAGVEARLEIYSRMWHVWQLYLSLPQAVRSLDDIAQFLRSRIGTNA
jgi:acetyl esterase/lipase